MAVMKIQNLDVTISGNSILSGINIPELKPGQLMGLIGPNAAGKSTLLRAIAGDIDSAGEITVGGSNLRSMDRLVRREHLSYMPQTLPQGSSLTPYELVRSFARATGQWVANETLNDRIGEIFSSLGLINDAHRPMTVLSGGKRQLVGVCLAMIHQPSLLLLDEPTSALDLHWQLAAIGVVRNYISTGRRSAVMALHDVNLAIRFCDNITVLRHGKAVSSGTPSDIVTPKMISDVYGVSARVEKCSAGVPFLLADSPL